MTLEEFVILFRLDAQNFKKGEREVRDSLKGVKDSSKKTFDDLEGGGKKAADVFRKVRNEAAALFLVFAGASSIKDFATSLVSGTASASRLGETLGISAGRVAGWRGALAAVGGTANEADAALSTMQQTLENFKFNPVAVNRGVLAALGINTEDLANGTPESLLLKLAEARKGKSAQDYSFLLQQLGLSSNTINLLLKGKDAVKALVDEQERRAHITKADEEAARKFDETMAKLSTTIKGQALPAVTLLLEAFQKLGDWFEHDNPFPSAERSIAGWQTLWLRIDKWRNERAAKYASSPEEREAAQRRADDDQRQMEAIAGRFPRSQGGTKNDGPTVDGNSSTSEIRRIFPGYQPPRARSRSSYIENYLQRSGLTAEQARGVAAALHAESQHNPNTVNPTSGAYGIGQWLGPRKRALFARYGRNPSLDQQLAFLVSELQGGDRGGASVLRQGSADDTMRAAITSFFRPQGANWERRADWLADIRRGRAYLNRGAATTRITTGPITINTQATDARGIARDLHGELRKRSVVAQADGGVAY